LFFGLVFHKVLFGSDYLIYFWSISISFISSIALYIICDFGIEDHVLRMYDSPFQSLLDMFYLTLGEIKDQYEELQLAKFEGLGKVKYRLKLKLNNIKKNSAIKLIVSYLGICTTCCNIAS